MKYLKTKNISKFSVSDRTFIVNPYGRITTNSTNSLQIPVGTEAQKPQTSLLNQGMIRITDPDLGTPSEGIGQFEVYQAGDWRPVKFKVPSQVSYSTPVAGNEIETIFYISPQPPLTIEDGAAWTGAQLMVYVENVFQLFNQNYVVITDPCDVTGDIISIDNSTKTITSSNTLVINFVETGFHAGQTITLSGTAGGTNDGNFTIDSVTSSTIVVDQVINNETAGAMINIVGKSSITNAAYPAGKYIRFFEPVPSTGVYGTVYVTIISGFDK
jgi:hypothetical protein